jgi:hypothetical protein
MKLKILFFALSVAILAGCTVVPAQPARVVYAAPAVSQAPVAPSVVYVQPAPVYYYPAPAYYPPYYWGPSIYFGGGYRGGHRGRR